MPPRVCLGEVAWGGDDYRRESQQLGPGWDGPESQDKGFGCCPVWTATSPKADQEANRPAPNVDGPRGVVSQLSTWRVLPPNQSLQEAMRQPPLTWAFAQTPQFRGYL